MCNECGQVSGHHARCPERTSDELEKCVVCNDELSDEVYEIMFDYHCESCALEWLEQQKRIAG